VVVTEWQHLVDQELQRKVTRRLLQIGLNMVFQVYVILVVSIASKRILPTVHLLPFYVHSLDRCHSVKKVFNEKCFLDVYWKVA